MQSVSKVCSKLCTFPFHECVKCGTDLTRFYCLSLSIPCCKRHCGGLPHCFQNFKGVVEKEDTIYWSIFCCICSAQWPVIGYCYFYFAEEETVAQRG